MSGSLKAFLNVNLILPCSISSKLELVLGIAFVLMIFIKDIRNKKIGIISSIIIPGAFL